MKQLMLVSALFLINSSLAAKTPNIPNLKENFVATKLSIVKNGIVVGTFTKLSGNPEDFTGTYTSKGRIFRVACKPLGFLIPCDATSSGNKNTLDLFDWVYTLDWKWGTSSKTWRSPFIGGTTLVVKP